MFKAIIGNTTYFGASDLELYFKPFRESIIGINQTFTSPYGTKKIVYADWTASGRLYGPIEEKMIRDFGPYVANTHTESNITGTTMTMAYHQAKKMIKQHVHADEHDVIILDGFGMTSVVNKLQRILGLRVPEYFKRQFFLREEDRPIIFVTHMEHHSNHISWRETIGDVVCLWPKKDGSIDLTLLQALLHKYRHRRLKIGSFTACSNVTGVMTPYHQMARIMHEHGGLCFADFAASAPYVEINMHPENPLEKLDAIFFSPHKFLGGPGTSGVMVFDGRLYKNAIPDKPGGGTVLWTNPWGGQHYYENIEEREDGGTPGFLQAIKKALCIKLKEKMRVTNILARERELKNLLLEGLQRIPGLHILDGNQKERLGIISFWVEHIHYNLMVRLLNDRFGIQVRGGCSCAGTYGHYLFQIDPYTSKWITGLIDQGNSSYKPGWVRISIHPTMTNEEIYFIIDAIRSIIENINDWQIDYLYNVEKNDFHHVTYFPEHNEMSDFDSDKTY